MLTGALGSVERKIAHLKDSKLKLSAQLEEAKKKAIETNRELGKIGATIEKLQHSRARLQTLQLKRDQMRMQVVDTVAIGMTVAFPVKKAIEFESAMADVAKVANLSEEETKKFGAELTRLSTKIPIAADGLASIAASGAQLGISKEKLIDFTKIVAKMSTAFSMGADEAGESIAKMMNIFGLSLKEITRLGDAINYLSDNTAAKAGEIVDVLARIGGTAKTFGLSAMQASALADAFLALGKTPETAATAINALLTKLATATQQNDKFKKALRSIGTSDIEIKFAIEDNPQAALEGFLKKLRNVEKNRRLEILSDLFGAEYSDDIALLVEGVQNLRKAFSLIDTSATAKLGLFAKALTYTTISATENEKALKELQGLFGELQLNDKNFDVLDSLGVEPNRFFDLLTKDKEKAINLIGSALEKLPKEKRITILTSLLGEEKAKKAIEDFESLKKVQVSIELSHKKVTNFIEALKTKKIELKPVFKELNLSHKRFFIDLEANPNKALLRLFTQLKKLDKEKRKEVLIALGNSDFTKDVLKNFSELSQEIEKLEQNSFVGSMEREFQNRAKTTANQLQLLSNSLSQIGIAIGSVILPPLKTGAHYLAQFFNWIAKLNEEFPLVGKAISYTAVGLGTLAVTSAAVGYGATFLISGWHRAKIATILLGNALSFTSMKARALSIWSGILGTKARATALTKGIWAAASTTLSGSLSLLGGALRAAGRGALWLGRALLLNPIGLAITAIAGGAYLIYRYWEPIKEFFGSLWDGVKSIFAKAANGIKSVLSFSPIGIVFRAYRPISEFFGNFWNSVGSLFSKGASFIGSVFTNPIGTIKKLFNQLFEWLAEKFGWVGSAVKKVFNLGASIGSAIKGLFGGDEEEKPKPKIGEAIKKVATTTTVATSLAVAQPTAPAVPDFAKMAQIQAPQPQVVQHIVQEPTWPVVTQNIKPKVFAPEPITIQAIAPEPVAVKAITPKPV
ncbi:MAG: phage tail tape measure protein, partial [Epsilonproteobacteria bacterium]|nr:phage tail tape measure protein [Campylobacterota bacterium]